MEIPFYLIVILGLALSGVLPTVYSHGFLLALVPHCFLLLIAGCRMWQKMHQQIMVLTRELEPVVQKYEERFGKLSRLQQKIKDEDNQQLLSFLTTQGIIDLALNFSGDFIWNFLENLGRSPEEQEIEAALKKGFLAIILERRRFRISLFLCAGISLIALIIKI
jgi:hypothetical protein